MRMKPEHHKRYELTTVSPAGLPRWRGWVGTLTEARAQARAKARPGRPVQIRRGPGKDYGEIVETVYDR